MDIGVSMNMKFVIVSKGSFENLNNIIYTCKAWLCEFPNYM